MHHRRRVWDSGAGRHWVDVPVWTLAPPVLPTKTPLRRCSPANRFFLYSTVHRVLQRYLGHAIE